MGFDMPLQARRWLLLTLSALCVACGGGGGGGGGVLADGATTDDVQTTIPHEAPPQVSRRTAIEATAFEAEAGADAALGAALAAAKGQLAADAAITYAGALEDERGNEILFAELTDASGTRRVALRHCLDGACVHAIQRRDPDGGFSWSDASGGALPLPSLAAPALVKALPHFDFEDPTTVVMQGALTGGELARVDVTKRRFVVASVYGPMFDLDLAPLQAAAEASGRFDSVEILSYVEEATLQRLMRELKDGDVLIWVGAGVRMKATSNGQFKTVGLTTARSALGDDTLHVGEVRELLKGNPFRSQALPSVLVLAGGETFGDGSWDPVTMDTELSPDSLILNMQTGDHQVLGTYGAVDAVALMASLEALFGCLFEGQALGACLEQGNLALERRSLQARLRRLPEAPAEDVVLPEPVGDFWAGSPLGAPPGTAELYLRVCITYECLGPNGKYTPDKAEDMHQNLYVRELSFEGPVFAANKDDDSTGAHLTGEGRLGGLDVGDTVLIRLEGDVSDRMQQVLLYAIATIQGVQTDEDGKGAYTMLEIDGDLTTSEFMFNGDVCRLKLPDPPESITTALSCNSEPSWIKLYH
jgi:hypothetical protein